VIEGVGMLRREAKRIDGAVGPNWAKSPKEATHAAASLATHRWH
jgi:hypothetical protein